MEDDKKEDRHGWKRNDSRIIRIDHSDVHIENERLGEDLEYTMANIHRSGYRQFLHRDSEITELRKSLSRMRHGSTKGSVLHRTSIDHLGPKQKVQAEKQMCHPQDEGSRTRHQWLKKSIQQRRISPRIRNISIKMPDVDKNASDIDATSDEEVDNEVSEYSEDVTDGARGYSRPISRKARTSKKESKHRPLSRTYEDPYPVNKRPLSLKKLMKILKLDEIPPAWYTTVVPASDVSLNKRPGRSILWELTDPSNNPHIHSWEPSRASEVTKSKWHSVDKRHQGNDPSFPVRPHTSLGMSHISDGRQTRSFSRANSPRSGNKPARPITAHGYLSQKVNVASSSKTVRQLKEMSEQEEQATISTKLRTGAELMLEETREKRKILDNKISLFLRSLDELQKARRCKEQRKNVDQGMSTPYALPYPNLTNLSSASERYITGAVEKRSEWNIATNTSRPTTVS